MQKRGSMEPPLDPPLTFKDVPFQEHAILVMEFKHRLTPSQMYERNGAWKESTNSFMNFTLLVFQMFTNEILTCSKINALFKTLYCSNKGSYAYTLLVCSNDAELWHDTYSEIMPFVMPASVHTFAGQQKRLVCQKGLTTNILGRNKWSFGC